MFIEQVLVLNCLASLNLHIISTHTQTQKKKKKKLQVLKLSVLSTF